MPSHYAEGLIDGCVKAIKQSLTNYGILERVKFEYMLLEEEPDVKVELSYDTSSINGVKVREITLLHSLFISDIIEYLAAVVKRIDSDETLRKAHEERKLLETYRSVLKEHNVNIKTVRYAMKHYNWGEIKTFAADEWEEIADLVREREEDQSQ